MEGVDRRNFLKLAGMLGGSVTVGALTPTIGLLKLSTPETLTFRAVAGREPRGAVRRRHEDGPCGSAGGHERHRPPGSLADDPGEGGPSRWCNPPHQRRGRGPISDRGRRESDRGNLGRSVAGNHSGAFPRLNVEPETSELIRAPLRRGSSRPSPLFSGVGALHRTLLARPQPSAAGIDSRKPLVRGCSQS